MQGIIIQGPTNYFKEVADHYSQYPNVVWTIETGHQMSLLHFCRSLLRKALKRDRKSLCTVDDVSTTSCISSKGNPPQLKGMLWSGYEKGVIFGSLLQTTHSVDFWDRFTAAIYVLLGFHAHAVSRSHVALWLNKPLQPSSYEIVLCRP